MAERVVTELVVDASGAAAGAAAYDASMRRVETASAKATASTAAVGAAVTKTGVIMTAGLGRQAASWSKLAAAADPVIAATKQLERATASSTAALAKGITTNEQVTSVLGHYRQRLDQATEAARRNTAGTKLNSGQVQNMTFQLNDMAVMLASGQSPFTMLMQQGMQMAQIFSPGTGLGSALKQIGTTLLDFAKNPLTLFVIGISTASAAAQFLFDSITGGGDAAEETLKRHADLVKRIKEAYGETDDAAKRYQETLADLAFDRRSVLVDLNKQLSGEFSGIVAAIDDFRNFQAGIFEEGPLAGTIDKFIEGFRNGEADIIAFNRELKEIANSDPTNRALQDMVGWMLEVSKTAADAAGMTKELNRAVEGMTSGGFLIPSSELARKDMADFGKMINEEIVNLDRLTEAHRAEVDALSAKSPAEKAAAAAARERISLLGQEMSQKEKDLRVNQAGALAYQQAIHEAATALTERKQAMADSVVAARIDLQTIGMTAGETARLTTELKLMTAAAEAQQETGIGITESELTAIRETAIAIGEITDEMTRLKIQSDLAFERGLIGLSPEDVAIAQRLRGIFGQDIPDALASSQAASIRLTGTLSFLVDIGRGIGKEFRDTWQQMAVGATVIDRLVKAHSYEIAALTAKSPMEKAAIAQAQERLRLVKEDMSAAERSARIFLVGALTRAQAEQEITRATEDRIRAMDQSVAAARLDLDTIGKTAGETARLTTHFKLLAAATEAAFKNGVEISPEELASIKAASDAIGKLTDEMARLKMQSDIAFERGLIGLSEADIAIAQRLRTLFGEDIPAALASSEAAALRLNGALQFLVGAGKAIGDAFRESMQQMAVSGTAMEKMTRMHQLELQLIATKNPAQRAAIEMEMERLRLIDVNISQAERDLQVQQKGDLIRTQGAHDVAEATRDRFEAMEQSVAQAQLELATIGMTAGETARLTTEFQLLTAAKKAAADVGGSVSAEEIERIKQTAAAIGALTTQIQSLKLNRDIMFERGLIGLSDEEVEIANQLRDIYGNDIPAALGSAEAAALRFNNELEKSAAVGEAIKDSLEGALEGLFTGAIKSVGEFVDVLTKGIAQAAAKALASRLTDKLFGGALGQVDSAGLQVSAALSTAAAGVASAAPVLSTAATSLDSAASHLTTAGSSLSTVATSISTAATTLTSASAAAANIGAGLSAPASGGGGLATVGVGGVKGQVAAALAPVFQGFLNDLAATGYKVTSLSSYRPGARIHGSGAPSFHGVGAAIDVNASQNPVRYGAGAPLITNLPSNIQSIANKWGLNWGGSWNSLKDPMHFDARNMGVSRTGGVPAMAGITSGSVPVATTAPVTTSAPLPVSVVKTPAPAFTGLQNLVKSPLFQTALGGFSMGYQQQSPLMGGLSGALSGLMAAGPVGAVVGGLAGAIGGLLGKSAAAREEMERAQEQWKAMAGEVEDFSNTLRGRVIGDLQTSFNSAQRKFDQIAEVAKKAGESVEGLAKDLDKFKRDAVDDFQRSFKAIQKSLSSGLGDADPWLQSANAIAALRDELKGFIADTKTAFTGERRQEKIDKAKEVSRQYVLDQITGDKKELTVLESEVRRIMGAKKEAIDLLMDLGMSMKKATAAVIAAMNEALAAAREAALQAIRDRSVGFLMREFEASMDPDNLGDVLARFEIDAQLQREEEIKNGGYAMVDLERAINAERLALINDFNDRAIAAQRQAMEDLDRSARTIVDYVNELRAGPGSTLSPTDQLSAAQSSYDAILALAQGGDADAQGSITKYADDLIKAAREMFASGEGFQTIFQQVQDQLLGLPAVTSTTDPVVAALRDVLDGVENTTIAVNELKTLIESSTPQQIALALTGAFTQIDTTLNEKLSLEELVSAGLGTAEQMSVLIASVDLNGDNQASMLELMLASDEESRQVLRDVTDAEPGKIATALSTYFTMLDTNIDGLLTAPELINSGLMTAAQAADTMAKLDTNHSGSISKLEVIRAEAEDTTDSIDPLNSLITSTNALLNDAGGTGKHTRKTVQGINRLGQLTADHLPGVYQRMNDLAKMYTQTKGIDYNIRDKKTENFNKVDVSNDGGYGSSGGIIGYPGGGIIGNGIFNQDSVVARFANGRGVMLAGGEGVINANATKMIGPSMIDLINNTGRLPASNDNGRFFMEQNRVLMAGFRSLIETLQSEVSALQMEIRRGSDKTSLAIDRKPVSQSATKVA